LEDIKMAKVYIGVGHGGSDPGAVKYLVEKDIDLQMAKGCRDYLKEHGVDVLISRTGDIDSSINEKTTMCNHWGADLALDIHNNAGGGEGFEVWHSVNGGKGKVLAQNIEKEVVKIGQKSRGLKTKKNAYGSDYFGFIRQTKCPAIICEGVFVDNKADAAKADTEEKCRAFGVAYAKGILATLGLGMNTEQNAAGETKESEQAAVQPEQTQTDTYRVKVTASALNIRKDAGTANAIIGVIRDKGVYTIVAEKTVSGQKWGKLKSGAGWICLEYTQKV
jgi:N-acetylmuramoyl-L-alanine amidase